MMEHRCIKARKAGLKKSRSNPFSNEVKERITLEYFQSKSSSLITSTCPECQQSLIMEKYHNPVPSHCRSNCRISKRMITSFDEKYLSHCLELIQISAAAKAVNLSVSAESNFASPRNVLAFSSKRWTLGSETCGQSMILRSPLFKHGMSNTDNNSEDFSFPSVRGSLESYGDASPSGFSLCSSPLVELESTNQTRESDDVTHKYTSADRTTCTWPVMSRGLLRCTRRNGITNFAFCTDHNREVYVTRSSKSVFSDGSSLDWTYFIYLSTGNGKEPDVRKLESSLVGRINVAARYKFTDNGSKIMETEFVLYGDNECLAGELDKSASSYDTGKRRRLPGKVSKLFKPLQLSKSRHRSNSNMWGTSTSLDLSSMMPEDDEDIDSDHIKCPSLLESDIPSNFQLAAIVVKEQVEMVQQENEMGGWGLNFLKRATEKQATDSRQGRERSMDVLVPTGFHGGPKPSSLIERSRNGGQCDCGGWDTGCPLSMLTTGLDNEGVRNSLSLYLKGEDGCARAPSMKMVNIQNGLYNMEYLPRLSALQCFSIAVAVIHSKNPTLRTNTQTS